MSLTVAIVTAVSLWVPDGKGHRNYRPIPQEGAQAILNRCLKTTTPLPCATLLDTLAFRESNNNPQAEHDHNKDGTPRGCGAFGALCTYPHATWQEQVDTAWTLILKSTETCTEPLALYVSGDCNRGHAIAREYLGIARRLAVQFADQVEH